MNKRDNNSRQLWIPQQISASWTMKKKVRFIATAAISYGGGNNSIRAIDLAQLLYIATGATTAVSLLGSIRLNRIDMYSAANPSDDVSLEFAQETTTFIGSPSVRLADRCVSSAYPAHVGASPPKNSLSGFWISGSASSTGAVVSISASTNAIVDLDVSICLLDTAVGQALTIVGGTAGTIAQRTLCGGLLAPVDFASFG